MNKTPDVSVIIANYNGRAHLEHSLPALENQDYPRDRMEIVVVDDASTDDSVNWLRKRHPAVRVIRNETNRRFAATNNHGVREAKGTLVALLNNDTRPLPDWLSQLVAAYGRERGVVAAGSKMLDWDGEHTTFYGGYVNFAGKGFEQWCRRGDPAEAMESYDMLFPCAGAALYDRSVFLDVGGFDEAYGMIYEDVDLGWRLNLFGHRCVFAPDSLVHHRIHGTLRSINYSLRAPFYERNALATIYKNYGQATLDRVLPAALLLAIKRSRILGWHAEHDWGVMSWFDEVFGSSGDPDQFHGDGLHHLNALDKFVDALPVFEAKRRAVQARRVRTDADLFARFFPRPFEPWALDEEHRQRLERGKYFETFEKVIETFGLSEVFSQGRA